METEVLAKLAEHDKRFDQHDERFDQHDRRFDQHDKRFDKIDQRLDEHGNELRRLGVAHEDLSSTVEKVLDVVLAIRESQVREGTLRATVDNHEHRIAALESFAKNA